MQQVANMMNRMLSPEQREDPTAQKMMEIMASESFQEQLEQQNPETPQEILQLFAQHGLTEAKGIDFDKILAEGQQRLEKAYKARNPGKEDHATKKSKQPWKNGFHQNDSTEQWTLWKGMEKKKVSAVWKKAIQSLLSK